MNRRTEDAGIQSTLHRFMRPQLRWEDGIEPPARIDRAAVIAQYSANAVATRSLTELIREFEKAGYYVILSSACVDPQPFEWPHGRPENLAVLRKPNIGYDFGSWAVAIAELPQLLDATHLITVNDSMVGPFWTLEPILDHFDSTTADLWGLTQSWQVKAHLQSFFIGYRQSAIQTPIFREFWSTVRVERSKQHVIDRYELGLSEMFRGEGFVMDAFIPGSLATPRGENPVIEGWRALPDLGVPFIKRELITRPEVGPKAETIPDVMKREYGIAIEEWL